MDALLPVLVGVAVLAVVIGVTRHALGARLHADGKEASKARQLAYDITVGAAGLLIVLVSVVTGRSLLTVEEPPGGELYETGVGVAPDDRAKPDPRHGGFLVGMATQFTSCDEPVAVTLGVVGSAEYYERRRAELRRPTTIRLALPSNGLRRAIAVDYGGRGYEDALKPPLARPAARPVGSPIVGRPVEHPDAEITSIGVTIDGWSSHLQSLVVRFEANWLRKRGLGTCYLALPPLVGEYTVLAAQAARNRTTREADGLVQVHPQLGDPLANNSSTVYAWYDRSLLVRNGISVVGESRDIVESSLPHRRGGVSRYCMLAAVAHDGRVRGAGSRPRSRRLRLRDPGTRVRIPGRGARLQRDRHARRGRRWPKTRPGAHPRGHICLARCGGAARARPRPASTLLATRRRLILVQRLRLNAAPT